MFGKHRIFSNCRLKERPETRWVLAVAIGDCAPAGGSGIQYFVGDFDGQHFTNENDKDTELWADFGADFYAPQTWNNAPDGASHLGGLDEQLDLCPGYPHQRPGAAR